jgi:hypothetical protein
LATFCIYWFDKKLIINVFEDPNEWLYEKDQIQWEIPQYHWVYEYGKRCIELRP